MLKLKGFIEDKKNILIIIAAIVIVVFVYYNSEYATTVSSEELVDAVVTNVEMKESKIRLVQMFRANKYYVYIENDGVENKINSFSLSNKVQEGDTIKVNRQEIKKLGFINNVRLVPALDQNNFIILD